MIIKKIKDSASSQTKKLTWLNKKINEAAAREHPPGMCMLGAPFIVNWFPDASMAQIYSTGLEFAFVSLEGKQCHAFAYCKDFLQDAVWATLNKSSVGIYGFSYVHGKNPPVDMDNMRLGVRVKGTPKEDMETMCRKALTFLQEVDAGQGFSPSELLLGGQRKGEKSKTFVFVSDPAWLHSPPMVSLYSLLVRVGMTYEGGGWRAHFDNAKKYIGKNDKTYIKSAQKGVNKIIGKDPTKIFAKEIKDNYPTGVSVSSMHNSSGIVAYAKGSVEAKIKSKWQKK